MRIKCECGDNVLRKCLAYRMINRFKQLLCFSEPHKVCLWIEYETSFAAKVKVVYGIGSVVEYTLYSL